MKFLLIVTILLISFAANAAKLVLSDVNVLCPKSERCSERTVKFKGLVGEYRSLLHFKDTLRVLASDGGYQSFSYVLQETEGRITLDLNFTLKPIIENINIGFIDRNIDFDPSQLLNIKEGDSFETLKLQQNVDGFQKRLEGMGFPNSSYTFDVKEKNEKVDINIAVTLGNPRIFKSINSNAESYYVKTYLVRKFLNLYDKPFDLTKFKMYLDEAQKELFSYGYYLIGLDFTPVYKKNRVTLDIKVSNEQLFAIDFKNLKIENRNNVHSIILDLFRKYKRPLPDNVIISALKEHYNSKARLNADFRIDISHHKNNYDEDVMLYRVYMDEKYKTRLKSVSFVGNKFYSESKIRSLFEDNAFELASINFYDEEYFKYFTDFLKSKYIEDGFVQVKIIGPNTEFDSEKLEARVEYLIQEGQRAIVRKISFDGLPGEYEDKILKSISNQENKPFNPITMAEDIKKVAITLQEHGYYYAEVANSSEEGLVTYSRTGSDVDIHFKIKAGPIVRLNRVLYLGNDKTKKIVLAKKIPLKEGDLLTPGRARDIESAISATGLFNSVSATPVRHNADNPATDLLIKVVERDYGLVEFAPGFRTDLGLKLTGVASYMNIGGLNRSITFSSQLNQRINYQTLDPKRRSGAKELLEHNTSIAYNQGDLFNTRVNLGMSAGYQFRRFYAFDANIFNTNATLTRDITRNLSSSLRYQLEDISQKNATYAKDNGQFKIGAITPSFTYDLRDSQVNPLKGAFFNISTEFANPFFLSQKENDLTINYYKLVSRNRFYVPFKNGTIALSLVGGVQENLDKTVLKDASGNPRTDANGHVMTRGYIPNIKVFRLTGMDIVRGFSDAELNKLPSKDDISNARVQNRAYMVSLKVEPRYFINDKLMAGVFYDAGRVFVDSVNFGELRDSVGVTFKILTPVGTLDLDYGIKLLREKNKDGSLESPGRFHVSIGFF